MPGFNKVIIVGNLTRDPVLQAMPSGSMICDFGVAINRRWKTQQGEDKEETCFVDCTAYGRQGETIQRFMRKGSLILVEGRLKYSQWMDKNTNQPRSKLNIVVETAQFLDRKDAAPQGGYDNQYQQGGYQGGGYQQGGYNQQQRFGGQQPSYQQQGGYQGGGYQGGYQQGGYNQQHFGGQQPGYGNQPFGGMPQAQPYRQNTPPQPPPFTPPPAVQDFQSSPKQNAGPSIPQPPPFQAPAPVDTPPADTPAPADKPATDSDAEDDLPF